MTLKVQLVQQLLPETQGSTEELFELTDRRLNAESVVGCVTTKFATELFPLLTTDLHD